MKTIPTAEQCKGKPFSEWSEAEVREEYLVLARTLDLVVAIEDAYPRRRYRMALLKNLLTSPPRKETRGRKQDVPLTHEQLLAIIRKGRDFGDKTIKATLQDYVNFYLAWKGFRVTGNSKRMVKRLQKRYSEVSKQFRK